jgi:hypothetical protein
MVTRLPAAAAAEVQSSVGGAIGVGRSIGGTAGRHVIAVAEQSFVNAMSRALVLGSIVALAGALVSLLWLPNRAEPDDAELRRMSELEAAGHAAHDEAAQPVGRGAKAVVERTER